MIERRYHANRSEQCTRCGGDLGTNGAWYLDRQRVCWSCAEDDQREDFYYGPTIPPWVDGAIWVAVAAVAVFVWRVCV